MRCCLAVEVVRRQCWETRDISGAGSWRHVWDVSFSASWICGWGGLLGLSAAQAVRQMLRCGCGLGIGWQQRLGKWSTTIAGGGSLRLIGWPHNG